MKRKGKEGDNLVLRIELLFELGDFTLFGGGEVLGIVSTHLAPFFCSSPCSIQMSMSMGDAEEKIGFGYDYQKEVQKRRRLFTLSYDR